jgi:hypothetical protein
MSISFMRPILYICGTKNDGTSPWELLWLPDEVVTPHSDYAKRSHGLRHLLQQSLSV